jgi:transposase-like protein
LVGQERHRVSSQKTKPVEREFSGTRSTQSPPQEVTDRLGGLLPEAEHERALEGLEPEQITGPGGLLSRLAGRVIETALGAELTEHLGYPPGQAPPGGAANHRNGSTKKTVRTELGPVAVKTPRDREGSFDPKLAAKRQTRLARLDDRILGSTPAG